MFTLEVFLLLFHDEVLVHSFFSKEHTKFCPKPKHYEVASLQPVQYFSCKQTIKKSSLNALRSRIMHKRSLNNQTTI